MIEQLHLLASFALVGLIWTIQVVHYPSFYYIKDDEFTRFEHFHSKSITFIVAPLMSIELICGCILFIRDWSSYIWILNILCILLIWLVTVFVSIPCHNKLLESKDTKAIERLIKTNWIRTALWSLKSLLIAFAH
jgi:hypothetical protein